MSPQTIEILVPAIAFVFGAIIGSFLNVVIYRLPRADEGLSISHPRLSLCPQCKATIRGYDNIPLLSYFILKGRCRACRAKIPLRYFVVELLTASLFAYLAVLYQPHWALAAVYAALTAALIAVTFIDIDLMIIPDKIDIPGMVLAPAISAALPALHQNGDLASLGLSIGSPHLAAAVSSGLGIAVGAGIIWLIALAAEGVLALLRRLRWTEKTEAMGFGDVKLLGMIGGFLGWKGVLLTLLLACFAGSAIGIVLRLVTKDSYIPFGPFLSLGALGVILWRAEVVHFIFDVWPRLFRFP